MSSRPLKTGDVVAGRYRIDSFLADGGMGSVFRATQLKLNRPVALKVMMPPPSRVEQARARFAREAQVASKLRHPGAVEIYDFGEHQESLFLCMRLIEGVLLSELIEASLPAMELHRAVGIAIQLAEVLQAAHAIALTHRDVKPDNIVLEPTRDASERAVLLDFGLAFMMSAEDSTGRLTRDGSFVGTPEYSSPEQACARPIGPPSDIYSLGCVLYELLTGAPPFDGDAAIVLARHLYMEPRTLRELWPDRNFPAVLDELVLRMLSKEPSARPTAASVCAALQAMDLGAPVRSRLSRAGLRLGRSARMLSERPTRSSAPAKPETNVETETDPSSPDAVDGAIRHDEGDIGEICIIGTVDDDLATGLVAHGFRVIHAASKSSSREHNKNQMGQVLPQCDAIVALDASLETLEILVQYGAPVLADGERGDMRRIRDLLRIGIAEVVSKPVSSAQLGRKLLRVLRLKPPAGES